MGQPLKIGDIENVSALSGLFSSSTINELASQGSYKRFLSLVDESVAAVAERLVEQAEAAE